MAPKITTEFPAEKIAYTGNGFAIDCAASGDPTAEVKWYANGTVKTYGGKLEVASAKKYGDLGMYQCFAINSAGADQRIVRVIVRDPGKTIFDQFVL